MSLVNGDALRSALLALVLPAQAATPGRHGHLADGSVLRP